MLQPKIAGALVSLALGVAGQGLNTDKDFWCVGKDTLDAAVMQDLWENQIPGEEYSVGGWLSRQEMVTGTVDNWIDTIVSAADPTIGNSGLGNCGVIGADCVVDADCNDWASRGYGKHYWVLQAYIGFHNKMNVAHEYLQDSTLENLMGLSDIAADFTRPTTWVSKDEMMAVLGAIFYLAGGIAGFGGLGPAQFVGTAVFRSGVAKAANRRAQDSIDELADGAAKQKLQRQADESMASALAMQQAIGSKVAGALGSSTYLVGGIFGAVGIGSPDPEGEVAAEDLEPMLQTMFSNARDYLAQLGRLASGRADPSLGDSYHYLPGQDSVKGDAYPSPSDIAKFFHDGNMLIGAADPNFNTTIEQAFSFGMKPRLVDQALVTGNFFVAADLNYDSKDLCEGEDGLASDPPSTGLDDTSSGYGSKWEKGYCMRLMRDTGSDQSCNALCRYVPAVKADYDNLQDKYGFNLRNYYTEALLCSAKGGETPNSRKPNLFDTPADGSFPRCWFGIEAKKYKQSCDTTIATTCHTEINDFEEGDV